MQSTPLTRIRDIAHRNDIPHDLKQEIKHTIQVLPHFSAFSPCLSVATLQCHACDSLYSLMLCFI
jgi:hypothetical protein